MNKIKQEKVPVYTYKGDRELLFFSGRGTNNTECVSRNKCFEENKA